MMESHRGCAFIEWARIGADHALSKIGNLKLLVLKIVFDKLRHRPVEKHGSRFAIVAETLFDLFACRSFADPDVSISRRPQRIAQAANDRAHGAKSLKILRRETLHLGIALRIVIPELDAAAIEEGNKQTVGRRGPGKAARG